MHDNTAVHPFPAPHTELITGLVLAGGRGARVGGQDKGLLGFAGRRLVEHVLAGLRPQVGAVLISANRNLTDYRALGHPVIADATGDFRGPLAGLAAAFEQMRTPWLLAVPCDAPLLPADLATRLASAAIDKQAFAAMAHDGAHLQPLFCLVHGSLAASLHAYLDGGGRKVREWLQQQHAAVADFADAASCFANPNTPEALRELEAAWARHA